MPLFAFGLEERMLASFFSKYYEFKELISFAINYPKTFRCGNLIFYIYPSWFVGFPKGFRHRFIKFEG